MFSYFFDNPNPNLQLSFVKVGWSVICAVFLKLSSTTLQNQFHDVTNPPIDQKTLQKKPLREAFKQKNIYKCKLFPKGGGGQPPSLYFFNLFFDNTKTISFKPVYMNEYLNAKVCKIRLT